MTKNCFKCGIEMKKKNRYSFKQWESLKFCSNGCRGRFTKKIRPKKSRFGHKNCSGKHWKVKDTSKYKNKIISEETRKKLSEVQTTRWGKVERKKYKRYVHVRDKKYLQWRSDVFSRDNWTCQTCGERGIYLEAHHIKSWAKFSEFRFDLDNGATLCRECHKLTDNYKNKK